MRDDGQKLEVSVSLRDREPRRLPELEVQSQSRPDNVWQLPLVIPDHRPKGKELPKDKYRTTCMM